MKQIILYELVRQLKHKPVLMRKLKTFALAGIAFAILAGGLVIWAGVSAIGYVASKVNQTVHAPTTRQNFESLKTQAQTLPKLQALNCWGKAQNLMAVEPWLARPILENLDNLRVACLQERRVHCEGHECTQTKKLMHTTEGATI